MTKPIIPVKNLKVADAQDEWFNEKAPKYGAGDIIIERALEKIPLKLLPEIDRSVLNSSDMFSKKGWEEAMKFVRKGRRCNEMDDLVGLSDAFIDFCEVWLEDNDLTITPQECSGYRGKWTFYFDDLSDCYLKFDGDLNKVLLDRWADCIMGD